MLFRSASTCWLVTRVEGELLAEVTPRIQALVDSTDGFALAEVDLQLRGGGSLMDAVQSGSSDLRLASLRTDRALIEAAREIAIELVGNDPSLAAHQALRGEIDIMLARRVKHDGSLEKRDLKASTEFLKRG